ncbi:hypothetical protein D7V97_20735 [Corallococcus sp. CA053C]|uniref:hypothetical protein n=1 Tax=Corallococcus sp. CA053C TaxID=2316732 RepID=UPI000EA062A8|nr:hypothetical protein [Corallococcus sp. CA053C]RKH07982.1 hypothetical protein D7V97_20735 [Corallococcus sp. CA053C]
MKPLPAFPTGDVHDFDFLMGEWDCINRRLKKRFAGSDDWDTFSSKTRCQPHLGGVANVEEAVFERGFSGMALRLFDVQQRRWSIYWVDSRGGVLMPPVHGGFTGDRGLFYGEDTDDGRTVQVQFRWTRQGADRARWEQAFSLDGESWETNWVMEFTRAMASTSASTDTTQ